MQKRIAHRGAALGALGAGLVAVAIGGLNLKSGFGWWVDLLCVTLAAAVVFPAIVLIVALLLKLLRKVPPLGGGVVVSAILLMAWPWLSPLGYAMSAALLLVECVLGASLATLLFGGLRYAAFGKKVVTLGAGALALAANVALLVFLHSDGFAQETPTHATAPLPPASQMSNPSLPGNAAVKTLSYRAASVDATAFLPDFHGWQAAARKQYWGFGIDHLPLNARVWYPQGPGPFPLVLMVHGNHEMSEPSDAGYAYLGSLLASRGFIFVSIDENFLNVGLFHEIPAEQPVRAWLMLEHLKQWRAWNATPGHPFFHKVNLDNIALMGHSRGGEAAATAALFNRLAYDPDDAAIRFHYGFGIKAVVAIAPADGQYLPAGQARTLTDVNYLTLQGANDADVSSFEGSRQWDRVHFTGQGDFFKSELYVYGANHSQFNTVWGRCDATGPKAWLLNLRPLLTAEAQQQIAKLYISAFLEATLHSRAEYRPLLRDHRAARAWLPDTLYLDRYLDSANQTVADFSEDADLTTTTLPGGKLAGRNLTTWYEGKIPVRNGDRGYNAVFLGWTGAANYTVDLPPAFARAQDAALTLSLAVDSEGEEDFSVALERDDGTQVAIPVSRFKTLTASVPVRFTKLEFLDRILYKEPSEPVFQSVELPFSAFGVDPTHLRRIHLVFDRTPSGELLISRIGMARRLRE